ncbi:putative Xaa-Pro aminopeptidase PEPP [Fusarium oligoseptatum]|uniref:Putative Xaa-Pro aminopeptidase PEPP n=2 Tax=Fusarium solani species complex TaxID=232080 RepID=A0A428S3A9_9HYPO|nr:putative Xaa-Pro aminopeptidase PEPP [Fusarium floridanum]RSL84183.1 putative Xaa-Pro aminopeptidase PEPP [Fusarium oligoseptatum]
MRVVELCREKVPNAKGYLYLEGRMSKLLEDSDELEPFRCYFVHDIESFKSALSIPPVDPEEIVWTGLL